MKRRQQILLLGGISLLAGAFLPWSTYTDPFIDYSINSVGYEGAGIITGSIGLLFVIGLMLRRKKLEKSCFIAGSILAILAGAILLVNFADVMYSSVEYTESGANTNVGSGLCLSLVGAMLIFIGGTLKVPAFPETTSIEPQRNDGGVL